jgi:L-cystine uptake protein TcyP (sodium:dicarboxylate symporter family)
MVIMPLIVVSMVSAVTKIDEVTSLGKIGGSVVAVLVLTTMISSVVAIGVTEVFSLSAEGMVSGDRETARLATIEGRQGRVDDLTVQSMHVSFIPRNIFLSLSGQAGAMSIISVVFFSILFGIAALKATEEHPEHKEAFHKGIDVLQTIVMRLVKIVMSLTPYGVMALMIRVVAGSDPRDILNLGKFIVASYNAIAIMFMVHGLLLHRVARRLVFH